MSKEPDNGHGDSDICLTIVELSVVNFISSLLGGSCANAGTCKRMYTYNKIE